MKNLIRLACIIPAYFAATSTFAQFSTPDGNNKIHYSAGNVGVGISNPASFFHVYQNDNKTGTGSGITVEQAGTGDALVQFLLSATRRWQIGIDNSNNDSFIISEGSGFGSGNRLAITTGGKVGIGTSSPSEKLQVHGNILLPNYGRLMQTYSDRVYSEFFTAGSGQGAGWVINGTYSGSGNPETNVTYAINPNAGQYNTGVGYFEFDANNKAWNFGAASAATALGDAITFTKLGYMDLNAQIWFSPSGNEQDFNIKNSGFVGIGTDDPDEKLHINGTTSITANIGTISDDTWKTGQHTFELQNDDSGDVVIALHRQGHGSASIRHTSIGGLTLTGNGSSSSNHLHILSNGKVGIGTSTPDSELAVNGTVHAKKFVADLIGWPDYVFSKNYNLRSLESTAEFIEENHHLPEIPSAAEVEENGIDLAEMNKLLLQKIEEMTLHMIDMKQEINALKEKVELGK